nr:MAG TPA: hypothetical protein [Caudoviricetes sp.]
MKISWQRTSQLNIRLSNMRYVTVTRETYEILRSVERTPFLQSIYCLIIYALNECSRVNKNHGKPCVSYYSDVCWIKIEQNVLYGIFFLLDV